MEIRKTYKKGVGRRRGLTGLETAIIVIAFVIIAAAFSFTVLNMGFTTAAKSREVISAGMEEASSAIELDGAVILHNTSTYQNVTFYIKLSVGKQPVDLRENNMTVSFTTDFYHAANIYDGGTNGLASGEKAAFSEITGDGDNLLESGEKWMLKINVSKVLEGQSQTKLNSGDWFTVELKPTTGGILTIKRTLPSNIDTVTDLGTYMWMGDGLR